MKISAMEGYQLASGAQKQNPLWAQESSEYRMK